MNLLLTDDRVEWICACGVENSGGIGENLTVGWKLINKSLYEYNENNDYSMSIVFSAMALECEASRLIKKWEQIRAGTRGIHMTDEDAEDILRKYLKIEDKLDAAAKLMDDDGLDEYVSRSDQWSGTLRNGFTSLGGNTLANSLSVSLFRKRNRILHSGYSSYGEEDAKQCYNYAKLGIEILQEMDQRRSDRFKKLGS